MKTWGGGWGVLLGWEGRGGTTFHNESECSTVVGRFKGQGRNRKEKPGGIAPMTNEKSRPCRNGGHKSMGIIVNRTHNSRGSTCEGNEGCLVRAGGRLLMVTGLGINKGCWRY